MVGDEIREEAEEADGRVIGDDLERLHDAVRDVLKQLRGLRLRAARHLDAEAEQNRCDDERQNGPAAEQFSKVGLREEVDDHVGHAQRAANLTFNQLIFTHDRRNEPHRHIHDNGGDRGSHKEG